MLYETFTAAFMRFKKLLSKLPKDTEIIFVGDLRDRGLRTKEAIDLVMRNNYQRVLENHDDYMISHIQERMNNRNFRIRWNVEDYMGGAQTL